MSHTVVSARALHVCRTAGGDGLVAGGTRGKDVGKRRGRWRKGRGTFPGEPRLEGGKAVVTSVEKETPGEGRCRVGVRTNERAAAEENGAEAWTPCAGDSRGTGCKLCAQDGGAKALRG